jgi:hypothetical protein
VKVYFEFSREIVDAGYFPSTICCSENPLYSMKKMQLADRVFSITGNTIVEHKNRNGAPSTMHISDEDKIVLELKAVLI